MEPTPELIEKICQIVRQGNDFETACLAHEIDSETIAEWEKFLSYPKTPWENFNNKLKFARAQFAVIMTSRIVAEGGAQGAKWLLERNEKRNAGPVAISGGGQFDGF